jgi:hypothetical protein
MASNHQSPGSPSDLSSPPHVGMTRRPAASRSGTSGAIRVTSVVDG